MSQLIDKIWNIAVVMGGESAERAVSLRSGNAIVKALNAKGIHTTVIDGISELLATDTDKYDAVFNILHGGEGENGELAGLLSCLKVKYTGSDLTGAVLSWHKDVAKTLVSQVGLMTPRSQTIRKIEDLNNHSKYNGPWIIKPTQEGSSVGLYLVKNKDKLAATLKTALTEVDSVLVEEYIQGTECTVTIIKDKALPVIRILPAVELYDYEAKYQNKTTQYFCPSGFEPSVEQALKNDALKAFEVLSLKGWARIDFIVDDKGNRWFLEANTTPGMTETSLVPKAAQAMGWSFDELVLKILSTAFENGEFNHD
ncbi:MAG: D-alanine--D-alanine ligase [Marinicellaceae bacterium]